MNSGSLPWFEILHAETLCVGLLANCVIAALLLGAAVDFIQRRWHAFSSGHKPDDMTNVVSMKDRVARNG